MHKSQPCHPNTVFLQTGRCPCRRWVGPQRVVRSQARSSWSSCCSLPHQPPLLATHWRAHKGRGNNRFSRPSQPRRPHHQGRHRREEKKNWEKVSLPKIHSSYWAKSCLLNGAYNLYHFNVTAEPQTEALWKLARRGLESGRVHSPFNPYRKAPHCV